MGVGGGGKGEGGRKVIPLQLRVRLDGNFTSNREGNRCFRANVHITGKENTSHTLSDTMLQRHEHVM